MSVKLELRDYQLEGVEKFEIWWLGPELEALIALTMGMGKTITAAACIRRFLDKLKPDGRILWLTHREELIDQSKDEIQGYTGEACEIEKAEKYYTGKARILVASVQSLRGTRLEKLAKNFTFDLVICDEAHRALALTWMQVKQAFPEAKVLNLTATPFRTDIGNRLELGTILVEKNTTDGIRMGVLVPPKPIGKLEINLGAVKKRLGDYDVGSLAQLLCKEEIVQGCLELIDKNCRGHKSILFAASVDHGKLLAERLRSIGFHVGEVYGEVLTPERQGYYQGIKDGTVDIIINNLCLTEGFNLPALDVAIMLRPTRNAALYLQCLDEETEILTPDGFRGINSIQDITTCAAYDLQTKHITWETVTQKVLRENDDEDMVAYSGPQMDFRVTTGHRMVFKTRNGNVRIETAAKMAQYTEVRIPIAGFQDARGLSLNDAEIEFLGWFLTDGTYNPANGTITISQAEHQPHFKDLVRCLDQCNFKYGEHVQREDTNYKRTSPQHYFYISKGKPRGKFKSKTGWGKLLPFIDKDLSQSFEQINREQMKVLLRAIHLGDGNKQRNQAWVQRSYHVVTGNIVFGERLQSLCIRRGFKCNLSPKGEGYWTLHIKDVQEHTLSNYKRPFPQVVPRTKGERVWCVTNRIGTLIARRHGKVFITGNCIGRVLRKDPNNPLKTHGFIIDIIDTAKRKGGKECPMPTEDDIRMYSAIKGRQASAAEVFLSWFYNAFDLANLVAGVKKVDELTRLDEPNRIYKLLAPPWMAHLDVNPAAGVLQTIWTPEGDYKALFRPFRIASPDAFRLMLGRKGWVYLPHNKLPQTDEQLGEYEVDAGPAETDSNYTLNTLISQDAQLRNFILDLFDPNQSLKDQAARCFDTFKSGETTYELAWFKVIHKVDTRFHFIQWKNGDINHILARTADGQIYSFEQIGKNRLEHKPGKEVKHSQLPDFVKGTTWANKSMSVKQAIHVAKILEISVHDATNMRISSLSASALMSNQWNKAHLRNIGKQLATLQSLTPVRYVDDTVMMMDVEVESTGLPIGAF